MELAPQKRFLLERYWAGAGRADVAAAEERLHRAAGELTSDGTAVRIMSSTWLPGDEVLLTLIEAAEEDDVLEVSRRGSYPIDRVQRAEVVTGASRGWSQDGENVRDQTPG